MTTEIGIVDLEGATSEQKAILMLLERVNKLEDTLAALLEPKKPKAVCAESAALRLRLEQIHEHIREQNLDFDRVALPAELRDSGIVDAEEIKRLASVAHEIRAGSIGEKLFHRIYDAFAFTEGFASKEAVAWLEKAIAPYMGLWQ